MVLRQDGSRTCRFLAMVAYMSADIMPQRQLTLIPMVTISRLVE
jgi:hypothetical protein